MGGYLSTSKCSKNYQTLLGRNVDLISKRAVERSQNWLRRQVNTAQVLFSKAEAAYAKE